MRSLVSLFAPPCSPSSYFHLKSSQISHLLPVYASKSDYIAPSSLRLRALQTSTSGENEGSRAGAIHVIIGPMFAGKTTALLRRMKEESCNGRDVTIVKSNQDDRYGLDCVVSHGGVKMACWALSNLSSFASKIGADAYGKLDVIGIDEAQFFEDLYEFCRDAADHHGKTVVVAGLDGDYLRRSFGSMLDIIPLADSVTKLSAHCRLCNKRAFFTLRKTKQTKTQIVGGADIYMPVCRKHYIDGQFIKNTTNLVLKTTPKDQQFCL
ncbi:Thymidine kinase [Zostera marina]|uniref:Thymidine kinase n=1 Tax=Zostera marina TaxID=29655 RepID=A0A0K9PFT1_ZOSMR|nr:Thymidine kinase [Zostera marina]